VNERDRNTLLNNANDKFTGYMNSITNQKFLTSEDSLSFWEEFQTNESVYVKSI
jgi:hypothetical protein